MGGHRRKGWGALLWLLLISVGILLGGEWEWLLVIPAVVLHEGGHCLAALLCGVRLQGLSWGLWGGRLHLGGLLSYGQELGISAAGPLVNLLCVWLLGCLPGGLLKTVPPLAVFLEASLGLGLLNLLPVDTLDGGRMLRALIARTISPSAADRVLALTTALILTALWVFAAYALLQGTPLMSGMLFLFFLLLRYVGKYDRTAP